MSAPRQSPETTYSRINTSQWPAVHSQALDYVRIDTPPPSYNNSVVPIITQPQRNGRSQNVQVVDRTHQPQVPINCPPGLESLATIDHLLVDEKTRFFTDINKYTIKNRFGQKVFYAVEEPDCCTHCFCGTQREFNIKVFDSSDNEVIRMFRPCVCCDRDVIEVSAPPGNVVGIVEHNSGIFRPTFSIKNAHGDMVLRIKRKSCVSHEFKILSADSRTEVGKISKHWAGFFREMFTDSDMFGISFPMDLDVRGKAVLLGACFLIDMMFFEDHKIKRTYLSEVRS